MIVQNSERKQALFFFLCFFGPLVFREVQNMWFETLSMVMLIANAIVIGVQTDFMAVNQLSSTPWHLRAFDLWCLSDNHLLMSPQYPKNSSFLTQKWFNLTHPPKKPTVSCFGVRFCIFFFVELVLRLLAHGRRFFSMSGCALVLVYLS